MSSRVFSAGANSGPGQRSSDPLALHRRVEVHGDRARLHRLVWTLLDNAIKYTPQGGRIDVSLERDGGHGRRRVQDNGIGMEPQYFEKIFGIFRCLQPRDKSSGSGMGLAICRKIVTRHEGHIWVESELGKGATFYFTLPRP